MSILNDSLQFHIKTNSENIGKYVILPGDPGRVPMIAKHLDNAVQVAQNREYNTYTGYLRGEKVSVTSTGIGGPSAAIAVEELIKCGAHTFIRVGTCGGMAMEVVGGDLVIAQAAIRGDGTSNEYLPEGYPAAADFTVTCALEQEAREISADKDGERYHVGIVQSKDSFYGQHSPGSMPIADYLEKRWDSYLKCGCLASEMEASAIFAVAFARKVRAGVVLTSLWNAERAKAGYNDAITHDVERAISCAVGALKRLIEIDKK